MNALAAELTVGRVVQNRTTEITHADLHYAVKRIRINRRPRNSTNLSPASHRCPLPPRIQLLPRRKTAPTNLNSREALQENAIKADERKKARQCDVRIVVPV